MALKVYNTLNKRKEDFIPHHRKEVRLYSCGPTVYDYFHIGNARAFLVPDMMRRYLEYRGYRVLHVMNFTDIDDKIIKRAREMGLSTEELAHRFIDAFFEDMEALSIKEAHYYPKATDHIEEIISLIEILKEKGFVYEEGGDIFFQTRMFKDYGALSGQDLSSLKEGVRIERDSRKKDPLDFVLWKASREGDPSWESPFGEGRPGWHSECCVMSRKYLGDPFDIHTGGSDLIFPHHENERAQSLAAYGGVFVKYWLHNGYINIDGEKMSKSLGNFFTTREILKEFDGEILRYFLLSKHYRSPINFTREELESARKGLERLINVVRNLKEDLLRLRLGGGGCDEDVTHERAILTQEREAFIESMDDDFNSARALGHLQSMVREANQLLEKSLEPRPHHHVLVKEYRETILELAGVLGFQLEKKEEGDRLPGVMDLLLDVREEARTRKDWAMADSIRDRLSRLGITVEDRVQGPTWYI